MAASETTCTHPCPSLQVKLTAAEDRLRETEADLERERQSLRATQDSLRAAQRGREDAERVAVKATADAEGQRKRADLLAKDAEGKGRAAKEAAGQVAKLEGLLRARGEELERALKEIR